MSSSSTTYRHGVLRINPKAQLTEAITSAKGAKATWDNEPEDICEAAAVDPPPSRNKTFVGVCRPFTPVFLKEVQAQLKKSEEIEAQLKKSEEIDAQLLESKEHEAAAVDPPPSKTFTQNLRQAIQSRIDEAYARRSRNIKIHKHLHSVVHKRKEDEVQLQADKEKLREYLKEAEAQLKKSEEDEAQLLESKEREAQLYAEKEKLREQVRLLQESHETEIRQKDTEIWNLKGELHYNNAYACRREMSLKQ